MFDARVGRFPVLLITVLALTAVGRGEPIWAAEACPAGAPTSDPGTQPIFTGFQSYINSQWTKAATTSTPPVDPLAVDSGNLTAACPSDGGTTCFFDTGLT